MFLRNPFTRWLWDARRSIPAWTVAIAAVAAMYAAFWPSVATPQMAQALSAYPPEVLAALNYTDVGTPEGYLNGAVYGLLVSMLVCIFMIAAGARAVAGDENAGTLDLILAHPVSRRRLALQRFAGVLVGMAVVALGLWLAMIALRGPVGFEAVTPGEFAAMTVHLAALGALFGALAFAVGAATGSRALALGVGAGGAVLAFLANGVFPQVQALTWTRDWSPFHWYLGGNPLVNGVQAGDLALLLGGTALLVALGTLAFDRRDVAV